MANIYYMDGKYVPDSEAVFPIHDLGLLRGYGCFDFMRTYNGRVIFIKDHVQRLFRSARQIGIDLPVSETELIHLVEDTLKRNPPVESNIRILVTGGSSPDFITPQDRPRIAIMVAPLSQYPQAWYTEGAKVITVPCTRAIPGAKSIDYIRAIMVLAEARQKGAMEAVYLDPGGFVREGTTSNLFAGHDHVHLVAQGALPEDPLPGLVLPGARDLRHLLQLVGGERLEEGAVTQHAGQHGPMLARGATRTSP